MVPIIYETLTPSLQGSVTGGFSRSTKRRRFLSPIYFTHKDYVAISGTHFSGRFRKGLGGQALMPGVVKSSGAQGVTKGRVARRSRFAGEGQERSSWLAVPDLSAPTFRFSPAVGVDGPVLIGGSSYSCDVIGLTGCHLVPVGGGCVMAVVACPPLPVARGRPPA